MKLLIKTHFLAKSLKGSYECVFAQLRCRHGYEIRDVSTKKCSYLFQSAYYWDRVESIFLFTNASLISDWVLESIKENADRVNTVSIRFKR